MANDYVRGYNSSGTVFMCVTLAGNALEASALPTLNIYMFGNTEIGATAASLMIDGTRYDFEVTNEEVELDGNRAELMRAPLNADGIAMLDKLAGVDEFAGVLHGPKRAYQKEIELDGDYRNAREEVQAASVSCVARGLEPVSYTHLDVYKRQLAHAQRRRYRYGARIAVVLLHVVGQVAREHSLQHGLSVHRIHARYRYEQYIAYQQAEHHPLFIEHLVEDEFKHARAPLLLIDYDLLALG